MNITMAKRASLRSRVIAVVINRFKEIRVRITEYIPIERFNIWADLFESTSGRFLREPYLMFNLVEVNYTFNDYDDYSKFTSEWQRLNTPIVETKRGFWKRIKVKLGL